MIKKLISILLIPISLCISANAEYTENEYKDFQELIEEGSNILKGIEITLFNAEVALSNKNYVSAQSLFRNLKNNYTYFLLEIEADYLIRKIWMGQILSDYLVTKNYNEYLHSISALSGKDWRIYLIDDIQLEFQKDHLSE